MKTRILIIEDEKDIRRFVRMALEDEGHTIIEADNVRRGLIDAASRRPDLVVLDLGLPDADGTDFIRDFRGWSTSPIVVLSARSMEADKVAALDAGADDYLVKPFGVMELLARVRAQLRRHGQAGLSGDACIVFGTITLDLARHMVMRDGETVHLTPIEYRLLAFLATQPDRVITYRQLLNCVWGAAHSEDVHYVRVHMANLRKKIEDQASQPRHLLTEVGVGYRFVG